MTGKALMVEASTQTTIQLHPAVSRERKRGKDAYLG